MMLDRFIRWFSLLAEDERWIYGFSKVDVVHRKSVAVPFNVIRLRN
jgi:hypothetical protein